MNATPRQSGKRLEHIAHVRDGLISIMDYELRSGNVDRREMLCLLAELTGFAIAMQPYGSMTPEAVMHLVKSEIERGNADAIKDAERRALQRPRKQHLN